MKAELFYEFGPYRLDPYQRILLKDGKSVSLDPQSFEVLHILVQYPGQILRREDLINAAWEIPVDDRALNFQIFHLRQALDDDSDRPTYIETVRRRGIRFKPGVRKVAINRTSEITEADNLYLKGRFFWHKSTSESIKRAIEYFEQALEKDPRYGLAYAGIADSWVLLGTFGHQSVPASEAMPKAEVAAMEALKINNEIAEAHSALASVKALYWWKWAEAEVEFKLATELSDNPMIRAWYSLCLAGRNEWQKARAEIEQALKSDPVSLILNAICGRIYYLARDYQKAVEQCQLVIEMEKHFYLSYLFQGHALRQQQKYPEALAAFETASRLTGNHPTVFAEIGNIRALMGERGGALEVLDELKKMGGETYVSPYLMAHIYFGLNDKAKMFEWLEWTYDEREAYLIFLTSDPLYDDLQTDPQFVDLVRRVGFAGGISSLAYCVWE
jgi:DNA-binding winged helix-turn-helix (wHTH) protein/Tfp pilus assembly protein PilF